MVERVVDGDTFIARRGPGSPRLRVRIIGIDAPESVRPGTPPQCHGAQASAYLAGLLKERRVRAAYQLGRPQDRFGRELWDVWLPDGTFVAGQAVQLGNARALRLRPHVRHAAYLSATEAAARMSGAGLWGACPAVPSTQ